MYVYVLCMVPIFKLASNLFITSKSVFTFRVRPRKRSKSNRKKKKKGKKWIVWIAVLLGGADEQIAARCSC